MSLSFVEIYSEKCLCVYNGSQCGPGLTSTFISTKHLHDLLESRSSTFITSLVSLKNQHISFQDKGSFIHPPHNCYSVLFHWLSMSHPCGNPRTTSWIAGVPELLILRYGCYQQACSRQGLVDPSPSPWDISKGVFLQRNQRESFSFGLGDISVSKVTLNRLLRCRLGHTWRNEHTNIIGICITENQESRLVLNTCVLWISIVSTSSIENLLRCCSLCVFNRVSQMFQFHAVHKVKALCLWAIKHHLKTKYASVSSTSGWESFRGQAFIVCFIALWRWENGLMITGLD